MSFKIAIASGKGGTGKTTVSVNLFEYFNRKNKSSATLVDCDVEEPNDVLFFENSTKKNTEVISQLIPEIDTNKCTFCRKCVDYCEFNAIVVIPPAEFAQVNASLCHSCGACLVACKENAITEKPMPIGELNFYQTLDQNMLVEGKLKIGSAMQTMLIRELKKQVQANGEIIIYDAPPGTSCPVVETISDTNFIILVSEPTPFGLHDLKLMVQLTKQLDIPFGLIINKAGLGSGDIYDYIENEGVELIGEIPFNRQYAKSYATAKLFGREPKEISESFKSIADKLGSKLTDL